MAGSTTTTPNGTLTTDPYATKYGADGKAIAPKFRHGSGYQKELQNYNAAIKDESIINRLGNLGGGSLYGTQAEKEGELAGLEQAKLGYGQGLAKTGEDVSRIRDLQKARTDQSGADPVSTAIMNAKAGNVANAQRNLAASGVKGGTAAGAIDNVAREQDQAIAASLYGQQRQSIADERSLASNTLAGTVAMSKGGKGEGNANNMPSAPETGGMTVICTELHRQGIMSDELYAKEVEFGKTVDPIVMAGYTFLATPIAKIMQKSKLCTTLCKYPAMAWARDMAGEENILGSLLFIFGVPLCYFVGKLKLSFSGAKYV